MAALVIDGKKLAQDLQHRLRSEVARVARESGRKPGLAVILVGNNPASKVYVAAKAKAAAACGIQTFDVALPHDVPQEALAKKIHELNRAKEVDGILLQLPLPKGLSEFEALGAIEPTKDVDGLHPFNQGLLLRGEVGIRPCTPLGIMALIDSARRDLGEPRDLARLRAVVVGRSVLVGKPIALLLLERHCTVTICHSRTVNLEEECARADILIAAIGRPRVIGVAHIKPQAIVIDVGINRIEDGGLVGDVDFTGACSRAAAVTPVPGGVGPMTIAMLLSNTVEAAARAQLGK